MRAVGRSPVSQPQYPIDRIKSLAGDVIVFGVLPLIILRTILPILPLHNSRRPSHRVRRAVAVYRLPDAVRCVAVSLCQSICRSVWLAGCYRRDNEPVFTANFIVCRRASDELKRCWLSRLASAAQLDLYSPAAHNTTMMKLMRPLMMMHASHTAAGTENDESRKGAGTHLNGAEKKL